MTQTSDLRKAIWMELKPLEERVDKLEALAKESKARHLIEMLLGWLIGKKNGGEYYIMRGER